jgi:hypothetical protein
MPPKGTNIAHLEQMDSPASAGVTEPATSWSLDYWANLPSTEYARQQGVKPVKDFAALCGTGAAEDWEGFDEALEQWHAANPAR